MMSRFLIFPIAFFAAFIACEPAELYKQEKEQSTELIQQALDDSAFAGAVILAGSSSEIFMHEAFGYSNRFDEEIREIADPVKMTTSHQFDLASLTKVLAAAYALMKLDSDGKISPDDPVSDYLPEFSRDDKSGITVRHLLTHTSGLMQWYPTYYVANSPEERRVFTAESELVGETGNTRRYSDMGYMLLGDIIEAVSGLPIDEYLEREIYGPMGLHQTGFIPNGDANRLVATSHGNPFEKKMVYDDEFGYTIDIDPRSWDGWREHTLIGEVNDGNAYYTHGGVAAHAGLFSTAGEVYDLLTVILNDGYFGDENIFSIESILRFLEQDEHGHGLGWMMTEAALHGKDLPEGSFGHTGFTGTNVIANRDEDRIMILLTNRQHVGVDEDGSYPDLRELRENLSEVWFGQGKQ